MNCRWDTSSTWAVWYPDKYLAEELNKIKSKNFNFTSLPLKLKDATGSPVRAVAS